MIKLRPKDVVKFKQELRDTQQGICPLCLKELPVVMKDCALDHCHDTGVIRGLLHMGCNKAEGSITQTIQRWGSSGADVNGFMIRLASYLTKDHTGVIYHLHKTDDEKRELRNLRARKARAAKKAREANK